MTSLKGAWGGPVEAAPEPQDPQIWDWPGYQKSRPEGPWNGIEDLFPEGKPQFPGPWPKKLLEAAKAHGWGFGPISLVMRLNHEHPQIPRLYACWLYSPDTGRWAFDSARDSLGNALKSGETVAAAKAAPVPDFEKYQVEWSHDGAALWCSACRVDIVASGDYPDLTLPLLGELATKHEWEAHMGEASGEHSDAAPE